MDKGLLGDSLSPPQGMILLMPISSEVRAAVRALTDQPLVGVLDGDLIADTENLYRLITQLNAQALRRLAEIDTRGLAPDAGAPTTEAWLKARLRWNHGPARRQVHLAQALHEHPVTAAALAQADITVEHAQVITAAIDALPATVDPETLHAAEQTLVQEAGGFSPTRLTRIAQTLHTGPGPRRPPAPGPGPARTRGTSWTYAPATTARWTGRSGSTRPWAPSCAP